MRSTVALGPNASRPAPETVLSGPTNIIDFMTVSPDDVFIPGGLPTETYVSRDHLGLEDDLGRWLERRQKPLLSVSGPTKSGKTVLLKKIVSDAMWLSGGAIDTADDFWTTVCDELEVFTDHVLTASRAQSTGAEVTGEAKAIVASVSGTGRVGDTLDKGISRGRSADPRSAARKALGERKPILIIDDFHYIDSDQQLLIVRGLKDLIFDGLAVVVAAVPHRAYDVVRVEKEMTGRVEPLPVTQWQDDDLSLIATQGFQALEVSVSPEIIARLVAESFGSPHLMQTHCLNLCIANRQGHVLNKVFAEPDWREFFEKQASATSKSAFDLLKTGPRTRTDRMVRKLKSGIQTDIYGAVLAAIENTGPRTTLVYEEIRSSLREILTSELPQRHEITNVLEQMTSIAKDKIEGEPVLEYDADYSTLHLADPFFAYYLRWAPANLKDIAVNRSAASPST